MIMVDSCSVSREAYIILLVGASPQEKMPVQQNRTVSPILLLGNKVGKRRAQMKTGGLGDGEAVSAEGQKVDGESLGWGRSGVAAKGTSDELLQGP